MQVPATVFADGVMLFRGPFRPFGTVEADSLAEELIAGLPPHELNCRFPEGYCFEVYDRTAATHAEAAAAAAGRGRTGVAEVAELSALDSGAALLRPQPPDQLLQKLPPSVVRDGTVVPVRAELERMLCGGRRATAAGAQRPDQGAQRPDQAALRAARLRRFQ